MELTLLEKNQIFGKDRLKIFDQIGVKAAITDYAIALGGYVSNNDFIENRTGSYWLQDANWDYKEIINNYALMIESDGRICRNLINSRDTGIRVALPYSEIAHKARNEVKTKSGIITLECGSLPRSAACYFMQQPLEDAYFRRRNIDGENLQSLEIERLGIVFTGDIRNCDEYDKPFISEEYPSIFTKGDIYTRVPIKKRHDITKTMELSNRETYQVGDFVWMKKEPVVWYHDEESGIVFTKDIITSGIQFKNIENYDGNFSKTDIYSFMNHFLIHDMDLAPRNPFENKNKSKVKTI